MILTKNNWIFSIKQIKKLKHPQKRWEAAKITYDYFPLSWSG